MGLGKILKAISGSPLSKLKKLATNAGLLDEVVGKELKTDTNKKILKALGKQAKVEWDNAEHLSQGVEVVANKLAKGLFEKVDYEGMGIEQKLNHPFGYKMKAGPSAVIAVGILGLSAGDTAMQVKNRNHMGRISEGEMANMVNKSRSPGIYSDRELNELKKPKRDPYSNHGAEGDLVFALHNLR